MSVEIELPDGTVLEAPDGADISTVAKNYMAKRARSATADKSEYDPSSPEFQAKYGPTSAMSALQRFVAGYGKANVDLARGAGQMVGQVSRQDVADSRQLDAPLMQSGWAAKLGNIGGNIAATIPALAIPGAASIPGAAAVGGGLGFLQPSTSTKETIINTGLGAATGAAGQYVGNKIAGYMGQRLADRSAKAAEEESLNSVRDAVLKQSRDVGYVVPPTAINPTATNTALESVAGKAATRQGAEAINARVSNALIKSDLGIPADRPITPEILDSIRKSAGKVYQAVRGAGRIAADDAYINDLASLENVGADLEGAFPGIGAQANEKVKALVTSLTQPNFDSSSAVGAFRFLSQKAKEGFKTAFASGDPQALDLARAQKGAADAIGGLIERNLAQSGNQALADAWQQARITIAKTYTAEAALKGGNIDAISLARQLRKGAPLTDGFKKVAQFGDYFGDAARIPKSGAGVSKLAAVTGGGTAAYLLGTGHPTAAAAAAASTAIPWGVRKALLTGAGQAALATPSYAPNMLGTAGLKTLQGVGRYAALPAFAAGAPLIRSEQQNTPQNWTPNP